MDFMVNASASVFSFEQSVAIFELFVVVLLKKITNITFINKHTVIDSSQKNRNKVTTKCSEGYRREVIQKNRSVN